MNPVGLNLCGDAAIVQIDHGIQKDYDDADKQGGSPMVRGDLLYLLALGISP